MKDRFHCSILILGNMARANSVKGRPREYVVCLHSTYINIIYCIIFFTFQSQVSRDNPLEDHCITHGLSDPDNPDLSEHCEHMHEPCQPCRNLLRTLDVVTDAVQRAKEQQDFDKLCYITEQAKTSIFNLKAHYLRAVAKDQKRKDTLESLQPQSGLIVMDWAMKYLPRFHREGQSDWFGKRGLSWHISVLFSKIDGELEAETFIHAFQTCAQDATTVTAIVHHLLKELSKQHTLSTVALRSDNASCYHNSNFPLLAKKLTETTGIKVSDISFSEAQDGKGPCDRRAGNVKSHVLRYLNEGNDVANAEQLKAAIESNGGVKRCKVYLCTMPPTSPPLVKCRLPSISTFSNFSLSDVGLTMWKVYGIGVGKFVFWKDMTAKKAADVILPALEVLECPTVSQEQARAVPHHLSVHHQPHEELVCPSNNLPDRESKDGQFSLFVCPEENCTASYQKYGFLQRHLELGLHKVRVPCDHKTVEDIAKVKFSKHAILRTAALANPEQSSSTESADELCIGWAQKTRATNVRFSEKQKNFISSKFFEGEKTGRKFTAEAISRQMKEVCDDSGGRLFTHKEFMNATQISGVIKRLSSKHKGDFQAAELAKIASDITLDL